MKIIDSLPLAQLRSQRQLARECFEESLYRGYQPLDEDDVKSLCERVELNPFRHYRGFDERSSFEDFSKACQLVYFAERREAAALFRAAKMKLPDYCYQYGAVEP